MNQKREQIQQENPQQKASRFSRMSFWYLRDLFRQGIKRSITENDVYENLDELKYDPIVNKFSKLWNNELKEKNPSTLRMFYNAYGLRTIIVGLIFSIVEIGIRCAQPLLLGGLIGYFSDSTDNGSFKGSAYLYASGIVLCSFLLLAIFNPLMLFLIEISMKLKIGSIGLIYSKILKLSKSAMIDGINGRVINLISNDVEKFELAVLFLHDLWKSPIETIIVGFLVYREIGISGVVGILFILSFIPIQTWMGKKTAYYRQKATKRTDIRVRLMNEIITGIQLIKMYCWEKSFAKLISDARTKELKAIKGSAYIQAFLLSLWSISRVSIFLTLITYVFMGNYLTSRQAFIVTAFYNNLNLSMAYVW